MDLYSVSKGLTNIAPNPNYNSQTKKLGVPSTIPTNDPAYDITNILMQNTLRTPLNPVIDTQGHDIDELLKYGITPSNLPRNYDKELAEAQSNWSKAINALGQTLVSEIGIGTIKGISDLFDFVGQTIGVSDHDYSNPVSQYLDNLQEAFKNEVAPIYSDPDRNTMFEGGLGNFGWWASNFPSVMSSLTLLIPSTGVTKGISAIGKATKLNSYAKKTMRALGSTAKAKGATAVGNWLRNPLTSDKLGIAFENGMIAALSRTMENYQESRQTYNDIYKEGSEALYKMSDKEYQEFLNRNTGNILGSDVDLTDRDAVAKYIARQSADRTFAMDWANVVFDMYQIYALRNIFTHAPEFIGSAATRKAQRLVTRYAGKTAKEAAELEAKRSAFSKGLETIGDYTVGFGTQIKASASEGVEEAINYIAQQEGVHLGEYLLNGKDKDNLSTGLIASYRNAGDRILNSYLKDSQLWDSAFWGVLGGVVFEGLGSQFKRLQQTISNRVERKGDETYKPSWWKLDNTSEVERMINEINSRNPKFNTYRETVAAIKAGKNPYVPAKPGEEQTLTETEQEILLEKAKNDYIDDMVVDARNNGTLKLLKAYLDSNELRQAFVDQGIVSREDAESFSRAALERADKIDEMYTDEVLHIADIASDVADEKGNTLPAEYIQMLASDNIRHRLNLEYFDSMLGRYETETAKLEKQLESVLDSTVGYRALVKTKQYLQKLAELKRQIDETDKVLKATPSITAEIRKEALEKELESVKTLAAKELPLASNIYALSAIEVGSFSPNGNFDVQDSKIVAKFDELLNGGLTDLTTSLGATDVNVESVIGELRKIQKDIKSVLTNGELDKISPALRQNYETLSAIEIARATETSMLNLTEDEIMTAINNIHNVVNDARQTAITQSTKTILDIQKANPNFDILRAIDEYRKGGSESIFDGLNAETKDSLKKALDVLNLTDKLNRNLFTNLGQLLAHNALAMAAERATPGNTATANPADTTSEENLNNLNPSESTEDSEQANPSQSSEETADGQENGQNKPFVPETSTISLTPSIDDDTINVGNATDDNSFDLISRPDGNYNLNITDETPEWLRRKTMNGDKGNITKLPIVNVDNTTGKLGVVENGEYEFSTTSNVASAPRVKQQPTLTPTTSTVSSTGEPAADFNAKPTTTTFESRDAAKSPEYMMAFGAMGRYLQKLKNGEKVSEAEMIESISEVFEDMDNPELIKEQIRQAFRSLAARKSQQYPGQFVDVIEALSSSITETPKDSKAFVKYNDAFRKAVEGLVKDYIKHIDRRQINGKYVISLESLLRYCNGETGDNINASAIFGAMRDYLTNDSEAKKKYIVIDKNNVDNENFLTDVSRTASDVVAFENGNMSHRINVLGFTSAFTQKQKDDFYAIFDTIQEGDELEIDTITDKFRTYFKYKGTRIGYIGKPTVKGNKLYSVNDGWKVYVSRTGNTFESELKDDLLKIVIPETDEAKEIFDILTELSYVKDYSEDIFDKLENNSIWKELCKKHADSSDTQELAIGLSKLWKYITTTTGNTIESTNDLIAKSLDGWFDKLGREYETAVDIAFNDRYTTVTVSQINAGGVIEAVNGISSANEKDIPVASEAIGEKLKGNVSLAIGSPASVGNAVVYAVAKEGITTLHPFSIARRGSTWVVLPQRNGVSKIVQAVPLATQDAKAGSIADRINKAVETQIRKLVEAACNDKNNYDALADFIELLFAQDKGIYYSRYFTSRAANKQYGNIGIGIGESKTSGNLVKGQDINLFDNRTKRNGRPTLTYKNLIDDAIPVKLPFTPDYAKQIADILIDRIKETARFSISTQQLEADNGIGHTYTRTDLFRRNKDNHVIIKIGEEVFNVGTSFNDFVLNNDLIRINMVPDAITGDNITRNPEKSFIGNPVLKFKINSTSSPVEEKNTIPTTKTPTITRESTLKILTDDSENKAEQLARLVLSDSTVNTLVKNGLLPTNLSYEANLPVNARWYKNSREVHVGDKFVDLFTSDRVYNINGTHTKKDSMRKQAIRKLIHERLHDIIHTKDNTKYVDRIEEIYNDFANALNSDEKAKQAFEKYLFKNKDKAEALEEFLVESLTSAELANYLNSVKVDGAYSVNGKQAKVSLLQKIMNVLKKLLGINKIKDNSLYAKEWLALSDEIQSTPEQLERFDSKQEQTEKLVEEETIEENKEQANTAGTKTDYATLDDIEEEDEYDSSIIESDNEIVSSPNDYINSLPINSRPKIANFVERGLFSISCK